MLSVLFILFLFTKALIRKSDNTLDLESRLSGVKSGWDSVCAKIKAMIGC